MNDLIKLGCVFVGTMAATFAARETARAIQIRKAKEQYKKASDMMDEMQKSVVEGMFK